MRMTDKEKMHYANHMNEVYKECDKYRSEKQCKEALIAQLQKEIDDARHNLSFEARKRVVKQEDNIAPDYTYNTIQRWY